MTAAELQNRIQRKARELPPELLQEVYDYMEYIVSKRNKKTSEQEQNMEKWWENMANFSDDFMTNRTQPPLDKSENIFE